MNSKQKRSDKDPQPSADNSQREKGGNVPYPKGAEKHAQGKAEHVKADQRFSLRSGGEEQPARGRGGKSLARPGPQAGGNTPVDQAKEDHDQKKAERVSEDRRW